MPSPTTPRNLETEALYWRNRAAELRRLLRYAHQKASYQKRRAEMWKRRAMR